MKRLTFKLLFAIFAICFFSCSEERGEPIPPNPDPDLRFDGITDGANLTNIDLSYKQLPRRGFEGFHLYINPKFKSLHPTLNEVEKIEDEYLIKRYSFIDEALHGNFFLYPSYYAAYVNGEVNITCDKILFGKEPGELLNEFFVLNKSYTPDLRCIVAGVEEPGFLSGFEDELPTDMAQIFSPEAWLSRYSYAWAFKEMPKEKYPRVTFYLTFPVKKEHTRDYASAIYDGETPERIFTEEVFTAECTVVFKW